MIGSRMQTFLARNLQEYQINGGSEQSDPEPTQLNSLLEATNRVNTIHPPYEKISEISVAQILIGDDGRFRWDAN